MSMRSSGLNEFVTNCTEIRSNGKQKVGYETMSQARRAAKVLKQKYKHRYEIYRCKKCTYFHLATARER